MQKKIHEVDFSGLEEGGRVVLGVFRLPFQQVFLRKVAYRFFNLTRCNCFIFRRIYEVCVRCEENFPNSSSACARGEFASY